MAATRKGAVRIFLSISLPVSLTMGHVARIARSREFPLPLAGEGVPRTKRPDLANGGTGSIVQFFGWLRKLWFMSTVRARAVRLHIPVRMTR